MTDAAKPNLCGSCRFFKMDSSRAFPDGYPFRGWGGCQRMGEQYVTDTEADGPEDGTLAITWDYEGYSSGMYVSPRFSCAMHEVKTDD